MIVQLTPDQIAQHWDVLSTGFMSAIPPTAGRGERLKANLLENCMIGKMQVWATFDESGNVIGAVLTTITSDPGTYVRNLFSYAVFSLGVSDKEWEDGLAVLSSFAKANGCFALTGLTSHEAIFNRTEELGWTRFATLIYTEVS